MHDTCLLRSGLRWRWGLWAAGEGRTAPGFMSCDHSCLLDPLGTIRVSNTQPVRHSV